MRFVIITVLIIRRKNIWRIDTYGQNTGRFLGNCIARIRAIVNRIQVPVQPRSLARYEPRLVAESAEPSGAAPALDLSDPMGKEFDYAKEFKSLDLNAVIKDLHALDDRLSGLVAGRFWPLWRAVHSHGVAQRRHLPHRRWPRRRRSRAAAFRALNSWPDNVNLDKARRLLWPIKQKYGRKISWADLMILAGNVALESMGFKTFGFGGGRADVWEPEQEIYWGPEGKWLADERYSGDRDLQNPLGGRSDGPDLRQSRRSERQPRSSRGGQGYSRNLPADGYERRRDRRADRWRSHFR